MNKLYYTVEKETYDDSTPNGIKTIRVYNKQVELVAELECFSDDLGEYLYSDWEEIQQYLDDNGYGDEEFEFVKLFV